MTPDRFGGAEKRNDALTAPLERKLASIVLPRIPPWLQTYHLTLATLAWSALFVLACAAAAGDRRWLWAASIVVALQWFTDHFDGKIGKLRGTGLVRWGFYADHLLDYVFLCAILVGYALVLPPRALFPLMCLLAITGGFMVHAFLAFAATGEFRISQGRFGPTEWRLGVVAVNGVLAVAGPDPVAAALPWATIGGGAVLTLIAWQTGRIIWRRDMAERDAFAKGHETP